MAGSATAWRLAPTHQVLVLEQHAFLHMHGSSHGGSRIFRHAYADAAYVALARRADEGWHELAHDAGEALLVRTGGLDFGTAGHPELDAIESVLRAAGESPERLSPSEVCRRFPAYRVSGDREAVYHDRAGILPATRCVAAMLRAAAGLGAELRDREPVIEIRAHEDAVEVRTPKAGYVADQVVVCTGSWLGSMLLELGLPLEVVQQQVLYLKASEARALSQPDCPVFIDHDTEVYGFPIYEHPGAVKVARHVGGLVLGSPQEKSDDRDEASAQTAVRVATSVFEGVTDEILWHETCLYTRTPDEHFVLGRHPERERIVLVGGGSGHAFKFAPEIGALAANMVANKSSEAVLKRFNPDRFGDGKLD